MPLRLTKAGDPQVGHFMTSLMVVDEAPRFWGQRLHTNGSEEYSPRFRRTLLERSGSPRNMFEGELSSAPSRRAVWGGASRSFDLELPLYRLRITLERQETQLRQHNCRIAAICPLRSGRFGAAPLYLPSPKIIY